jgi:Niemann-Pick C1 protein
MRGICGKRKDGDPLYCPDNGAAQEPSSELATAMQKTCPTLWAQQGGQAGKFCCSADQVATIASSVSAQLLPVVCMQNDAVQQRHGHKGCSDV